MAQETDLIEMYKQLEDEEQESVEELNPEKPTDPLIEAYKKQDSMTPSRSVLGTMRAYLDAGFMSAWTNASAAMQSLMLEDEYATIDAAKGEYGYFDMIYDIAKSKLSNPGFSSIPTDPLIRYGKSRAVSHADKYNTDIEYKKQVDLMEETLNQTLGKNVLQKQKRLQQKFNEKGYNDLNEGVLGGVTSTIQFVPAAIATIATRSPVVLEGYLAMMGLQTKGLTFADNIERGEDYSTAMSNSNMHGLIEAGLGRVGFGPNSKFMKAFMEKNDGAFTKMIKQAPKNILVEIGAENATTILQETSSVLHGVQTEIKTALDNMDNPEYQGPTLGSLVVDYLTTTSIAAAVGAGGTMGVTGTLKLTTDYASELAKAGIKKGDELLKEHNRVVKNVEKSNRVLNKFTVDAADSNSQMDFANQQDLTEYIAREIVTLDIETAEPQKSKVKFPRMDKPIKPRSLFKNGFESQFPERGEVAAAFGYSKLPPFLLAPKGQGITSIDGIQDILRDNGFLPPLEVYEGAPNPDETDETFNILLENKPNTEYLSNRPNFEATFDVAMKDFLNGRTEPLAPGVRTQEFLSPQKIRSINRLKQDDVDESLERLEEAGVIEQNDNGDFAIIKNQQPSIPQDVSTTTATIESTQQDVPIDEQTAQQEVARQENNLIDTVFVQKRPKKNKVVDDPDPVNSFDYNDLGSFMNTWEGIVNKYADSMTHFRKITGGLLEQLGLEGVEQRFADAGIDPTKKDWRPDLQADIFQGKVVETNAVIQDTILPKLVKHLKDGKITLDEFSHFLMNLHAPERNIQVKKNNQNELKKLETQTKPLTKRQKKRVVELKEKIERESGSGIATNNATDVLSEYGVEIMSDGTAIGKNQRGKDLIAGYENFMKTMLDMKRDAYKRSELVDEKQIDDWNENYKYYVPLKGFAEDTLEIDGVKQERRDSANGLISKQLGTPKNLEKTAKGRESIAADPVTQTISDVVAAEIYAQKNKVYSAAGELGLVFPQSELWDVRKDNGTEGTWAWDTNPRLPSTSQFSFKSKGQSYVMTLKKKRLADGMENLDNSVNHAFFKAARGFTSYLSYVNTSIDPEFVMNNFLRDVQTGYFNLTTEADMKGGRFEGVSELAKENARKQYTAKNLFGNMKAYYKYERSRNDPSILGALDPQSEKFKIVKLFKNSGAQTGFLDQRTLEQREKDMRYLMDIYQGDAKANTKRGLKAVASYIEDVNFSVENAARLTAFEIYINAKGGPDKVNQADLDRAASLAKNLTVNFNRGGTNTGVMNSLFLFFNASVQGTANVFRGAMSEQKMKIFAGLASVASGATMYNVLSSGEDDDGDLYYEKISDFDKMTGLIIMLPNVGRIDGKFTVEKYGLAGRGKRYFMVDQKGKKRPVAFKIPLPYGYAFFSNLGRVTTEMALAKGMDNYDKDIGDASLELGQSLVSNYSPIGFDQSENAWVNITKTVSPDAFFVKQATELLVNEDFFGAPIYFQNFPGQNRPSSWHENNKTGDGLESLTKTLNEFTGGTSYAPGKIDIDPSILQYWINYATGGLGRNMGRVSRIAFSEDEAGIEQTPFVRRLFLTTRDVQDSSEFFDNYTDLKSIQDSYRTGMKEERKIDPDVWLDKNESWARDFINTDSEKLTRRRGNRSTLAAIDRKIKEYNKVEDEIRANYYEDDREKYYEKLTLLNLKRNSYYKSVNKNIEDSKKQD